MSVEWARQSEYRVRFGWAVPAVEVMAGDVIVIVDVLRFTTAVEAAASRGAIVFPYRWRDESAAVFAESVGAKLADEKDPLGPSLRPASLLTMKAGEAVVLPSPNGSTCAAAAKATGATVVAACLRNASAVAEWVTSRHGSVSVIACGERWPDGSLRPALEDLLGAGAVLSELPEPRSPDARAAMSAWLEASATIDATLLECPSGRELLERGRRDDVRYAAQVDVSEVIPVLRDGAFRGEYAATQRRVSASHGGRSHVSHRQGRDDRMRHHGGVARTFRRAAKVLLVDPNQRVLLFRGIDRTRPDDAPRWFAVGGALQPGEGLAAAAVREVFEETGLVIADPGPAVMTTRFEWEFEGSAYDQEETYFLVPVSDFVPYAAGWSDTEQATMRGHRWWSVDELRATKDRVYPDGLADLLERLLAG